jgi:hypothetical protein
MRVVECKKPLKYSTFESWDCVALFVHAHKITIAEARDVQLFLVCIQEIWKRLDLFTENTGLRWQCLCLFSSVATAGIIDFAGWGWPSLPRWSSCQHWILREKVVIGQYSTFKACNIEVLYQTETFIYWMPSISLHLIGLRSYPLTNSHHNDAEAPRTLNILIQLPSFKRFYKNQTTFYGLQEVTEIVQYLHYFNKDS